MRKDEQTNRQTDRVFIFEKVASELLFGLRIKNWGKKKKTQNMLKKKSGGKKRTSKKLKEKKNGGQKKWCL